MAHFILPKTTARLGILQHLGRFLQALTSDCEYLVTVEKLTSASRRRTLDQNSLQHKWHTEAAQQLGEGTAEDYRAFCKLYFGVPILRAESPDFREQYDSIIRPLPYEKKLDLMKAPIDLPVTRLMSVKQTTQYLDEVQRHYMSQGVALTIPEAA